MKKFFKEILTINILLLSSYTYSSEVNFAEKVEFLRTVELDATHILNANTFTQKYQVQKLEPKFCPFNSTGNESLEKSLAVLAKGFDGDCLGESNEFAKKLVDESIQLETAIKDNPHMSSNASMTSYLDQNKINTIFAGLDAALSFESCSDEKKKSLLNRSSSVLRSIAQLGLYSASTTTSSASYGLLIASSALTFIDNLLERGFSFGDKQDIKMFKELNCTYYDIRQKLKTINFYKRPTLEMEQDYKEMGGLITKIDSSINKKILSIKETINKEISQASILNTKAITKKITTLEGIIEDLPSTLSKTNEVLLVLDYLVLNSELIKTTVSSGYLLPKPPWRGLSYSNQDFSDQLDKLGNITSADQLAKSSLKDFQENFYTPLRDHFLRVSQDMNKRKNKAKKDFIDNGSFTKESDSYHIATLILQMKSKRLKAVLDKTQGLLKGLNISKDELYSVVKRKVQSRQDSFDNGDENIIELSRKLNDYLYGKLGDKFIDAVNEDASDTFKEYRVRIERLVELHFDGTYSKQLQDTGNDMIHNFCVNSQDVIELAMLGSTQIERAYDFFATNDYLIRQSNGRVLFSSPRKNLHDNSQSALKAKSIRENIRTNYPTLLDILDQDVIDEIEELKTSWWKADSVGHNMIKATMSERYVIWLEKVRDLYKCSSQHQIRFVD